MNAPWYSLLIAGAVACSLVPLLFFAVNLFFYRAPRASAGRLPPVSVLIPARNEEASISAAVRSVLASRGIELELLVLDDASHDRTGELVAGIAAEDPRVALHAAPPLPAGWNGKQHACAALARLARHGLLCFLDADVRLAPDALARLVSELEGRRLDLLSGFPREETGTWLEKLLLPLIHFVLLCYLPLPFAIARPRSPAFAAGCGQVFLVRAGAYAGSGGHAAIRETMHDGLLLPQSLRRAGFTTGLCDLTTLGRCRMYRNAGEVWRGLGKNATEGMAAPARIVPFTLLLFFGQVLPIFLLGYALWTGKPLLWPTLAVAAGYAVRLLSVWRFRQSRLGALLHPVGVFILLVHQWWALAGKLRGRRAVWKERAYDVG